MISRGDDDERVLRQIVHGGVHRRVATAPDRYHDHRGTHLRATHRDGDVRYPSEEIGDGASAVAVEDSDGVELGAPRDAEVRRGGGGGHRGAVRQTRRLSTTFGHGVERFGRGSRVGRGRGRGRGRDRGRGRSGSVDGRSRVVGGVDASRELRVVLVDWCVEEEDMHAGSGARPRVRAGRRETRRRGCEEERRAVQWEVGLVDAVERPRGGGEGEGGRADDDRESQRVKRRGEASGRPVSQRAWT